MAIDYESIIKNEPDADIMRSQIAAGIGQAQDTADNAVDTANQAKSTADNNNNRMNNILSGQIEGKDQEVVDAHHSNTTQRNFNFIGERMDEFDSSLANIMQVNLRYLDPVNNVHENDTRTDIADLINTAIANHAVFGHRFKLIIPFNIKIYSKLIIDTTICTLIGEGGIGIDATPITNGEAMLFNGTVESNVATNMLSYMEGIHLIGGYTNLGESAPSSIGWKFEQDKSNFNLGPSRYVIRNCSVEGFGIGLQMTSNAYLEYFDNISIFKCDCCLDIPSRYVNGVLVNDNYGENIAFNHCIFWGSNRFLNIRCDIGFIKFLVCSLDHPNNSWGTIEDARVDLIACHYEGAYYYYESGNFVPFTFIGTAKVNIDGGTYYLNYDWTKPIPQDSTIPFLFNSSQLITKDLSDPTIVIKNGSLSVRNLHLMNIKTTTGRLCYGAIHTDNIDCDLPILTSDVENKLFDGGFEHSGYVTEDGFLADSFIDNWFLPDRNKANNRHSGTGMEVTVVSPGRGDANSKCLNITLTSTPNMAANYNAAVPIKVGEKPCFEFYWSSSFTEKTLWVSGYYAILRDDIDKPLITNLVRAFTPFQVALDNASTWKKVFTPVRPLEAPSWATHFILWLGLPADTGWVILDDAIITAI